MNKPVTMKFATFLGVLALSYNIAYCADSKRIYLIAVGHDYGAYEYLNDGGYLQGFNYDLISAVCAEAGVDCRTVWEPYQHCLKSEAGHHSRAGVGLMDRWYDACIGWSVTVERNAYLKFSASYLKNARGGFIVKVSDTSFDPKNFKNKKIGFMDGYVDDEKCVARNTGTVLPVTNIVHYKTKEQLMDDLQSGKIDAGYVSEGVWGKDARFKHVDPWYQCRVRGEAIVSKKDSDFPAIWNEGFAKLVSSGRFQKMCTEAVDKHKADEKGYEILCV